MIHRHLILFLLLVVLPWCYVDMRYLCRRSTSGRWLRAGWWLAGGFLLAYTAGLALTPGFIPRNPLWMEVYLWLLGVLVIPLWLFSLCSLLEWMHNRYHQTRVEWGSRVGALIAAAAVVAFVYGSTWGFSQVRVRHVDVELPHLPPAFDGLRIAHVSDLHVGSYTGWRRRILENAVDSILAQHPDLICFTGDLQNVRPEEVSAVADILRRLPDVLAVTGNHDGGHYAGGTPQAQRQQTQRLKAIVQTDLDWVLLDNRNIVLNDSTGQQRLYIAGTENDGRPPMPSTADYAQATRDIPAGSFVVMLQHDPTAWQRHILPQTTAQLTLSGHTHGGQLSVMGWRPTQLIYQEDYGLYARDGRYLHVSSGLGGLVPFRLGMTGEIAIVTLHTKK